MNRMHRRLLVIASAIVVMLLLTLAIAAIRPFPSQISHENLSRILPAMTREEWQALPESVRYFIPWDRARKPLTVKKVAAPAKATKGGKR